MSLGARNSKRSRSQSPGLLFRGDRQGVAAPVRRMAGEPKPAGPRGTSGSRRPPCCRARLGRRPSKRSRARETRRQKNGDRRSCRNRVSATEFWLGPERAPVETPDWGAAVANGSQGSGAAGERSRRPWDEVSHWGSLQGAPREIGCKWAIDEYARECSSNGGKINEIA